jgi:hypothetical protein
MKGVWVLLLLPIIGLAKTPEVYHCQQADGSVVIQDRRCLATHSRTVKPVEHKKTTQATATKPRTSGQLPGVSRRPALQAPDRRHGKQAKSRYFQLGWERFLPANWLLIKNESPFVHHLWLSLQRFTGGQDFNQGVKLSVYPATHRSYRQGAFTQALDLYHGIREQYQEQLLDSQFKSHERFKVFNLKYQLSDKRLALTEFYIDEFNNDLFVLTIQSDIASWRRHEQLATQIISQL